MLKFNLTLDKLDRGKLDHILSLIPPQEDGAHKLRYLRSIYELEYFTLNEYQLFSSLKGYDLRYGLKKQYRNYIFDDSIVFVIMKNNKMFNLKISILK